MELHFNKIARGPAWERWAILEVLLGDTAIAGEIVVTFSDDTAYADAECDVYFTRELNEDELEDLVDSVMTILSGRGNVNVYIAHEVMCQGFSQVDDDMENPN